MKTLVASFTFTKSIYPQHHPQNGITYKKKNRGAHPVLGRLFCSPYVCHLSWPRVLAAQEHYLHKHQFISATSLLWDQHQNLLQIIKTMMFYVCKTVSPALSAYLSNTITEHSFLETNTLHHEHQFHYYNCCHCQLFSTEVYKWQMQCVSWTTGVKIFTSEQVNLNLSMAASQGK